MENFMAILSNRSAHSIPQEINLTRIVHGSVA